VGLVACEKHGPHSGPMCCSHVLDAVYASAPRIEFGTHRFDVLGENSEILEHIICTGCAARYELSPHAPIRDEVWGDPGRFPDVCPVCECCFKEWTSAHA
jgi:hypothetical protein